MAAGKISITVKPNSLSTTRISGSLRTSPTFEKIGYRQYPIQFLSANAFFTASHTCCSVDPVPDFIASVVINLLLVSSRVICYFRAEFMTRDESLLREIALTLEG